MSEKINHWCVICGRGYYACDACDKTNNYASWRSLADSMEHFRIFMILKDYRDKRISKNEAKKRLSRLDLSRKDSFKVSARTVLDEILKETPAKRKTPQKRRETNDLS